MAAENPIIVSGADSGYFELLAGTVRSIRDKPEGAGFALGVLDAGLTAGAVPLAGRPRRRRRGAGLGPGFSRP